MKNKRVIAIMAAIGLASLSVLAGSATWNFNSDPTTGTNPLTLLGSGSARRGSFCSQA